MYFCEINTLKIDLSNSLLLSIIVLILSAEKSAIYATAGKYNTRIQSFSCKQLPKQLDTCVCIYNRDNNNNILYSNKYQYWYIEYLHKH